ncbi:MAG: hypothetical protein J0L55_03195 [Caulobacterales bacterium]|nr:hypothetical protein [Caulobacterales bacterium]MCA0371742.1 hypothetical protein [Pseudomonadota bacterium]
MKISKIYFSILASSIASIALMPNGALARPKVVAAKPVPKKPIVVETVVEPKTETAPPPVAPPPPPAPPPIDYAAIKAANDLVLQKAKASKEAGDLVGASKLWQNVYENSATDTDGMKQSLEAAKNLGFYSLETQDVRRAEAYFAAESVLARKLYFSGSVNSKPLTEGIKHWASAAGLMMRSNDSAALVFYAREINARERAALSSQVLNRDADFAADKIEGVRVDTGSFCATSYIPLLAKKVSCEDERAAKSEALSLQARQIKADAPKPMSKEEREKKDKEKGGEE